MSHEPDPGPPFTRHAEMRCPYCQAPITASASLLDPSGRAQMRPDALVLCAGCFEISLTVDTVLLGLTLRVLTQAELDVVELRFGDIRAFARRRDRELRDGEPD